MNAGTRTERQRTVLEPWTDGPWTPRQWQREAIPEVIAAIRKGVPGHPVRPLVSAVMGSGKSIMLSELTHIAFHGRRYEEDVIIIAAPRQNLVTQLGKTVRTRLGRENVGLYYQHAKQPRKPVIVSCYQSLPGLTRELVDLGRRVALFIGDEAHRTECDTVQAAWAALRPAAAVGVTATPYRADERESLSLWTEVCYRYSLDDAMKDQVLVPFKALRIRREWVESGEVAAEGMSGLDQGCLRLIQEADRKGLPWFPLISSAYDCDDADGFAAFLNDNGIPAGVVHSKQSRSENARAIHQLEKGQLKVLVQVNMLSEGSDFPWLRGLLLRRDIASAVMAFQFLGRGLRSCPDIGKEFCVVLDPHRNLDRHGAGRAESLGEAMLEAAAEQREREARGEAAPPEPKEIRLQFVDDVEDWCAEVLTAMLVAGWVEPPKEEHRRRSDGEDNLPWRAEPPSESQLALLDRMRWATKFLPKDARKPCRKLLDHAEDLSKGAVSDLASILIGLSNVTRQTRDEAKRYAEENGTWQGAPQWSWPDRVEVPQCPPPPKPLRQALRERQKEAS